MSEQSWLGSKSSNCFHVWQTNPSGSRNLFICGIFIIILIVALSNRFFYDEILPLKSFSFATLKKNVGAFKSSRSDHYFVELQFGSRFASRRSSIGFNYSESFFRASSSPILWVDDFGDVRWNRAAEEEMFIYLKNKQTIEGNYSDEEAIDTCLDRQYFVIKQHLWGFFSRYHCFIEQFGQTLYGPWMTMLSYNRFIIPQRHFDDFLDEGILRYFEPLSTCSKYLRHPRMKQIELQLRNNKSRTRPVTEIHQLLYKSWLTKNDFIWLDSEKVWEFGYEDVPIRRWLFSRSGISPTYELPVTVLINHQNEHIYRSPIWKDENLTRWTPRNRPWRPPARHLTGRLYRTNWQDQAFTGFLRYMFVGYFHQLAPRIQKMTDLLSEHWSTYLKDKDGRALNETAGIFVRRGDKSVEDSFWKKFGRWRNLSLYVKGLVDEERQQNRRFSSVFIMTDDTLVMQSMHDYANLQSIGTDEPYARQHLRGRQILYNVFAPQACFDPFNRVGFDQFLVSLEFIVRHVQFTVSHADSNVGRYLEEITYVQHQLKPTVHSNSFVKDAPDSL